MTMVIFLETYRLSIALKEGRTVNKNKDSSAPVTARVKLTLHTGERFFGPGICELLEGINRTGSIQAAAAEMEMSYSKAWRILNRAEREMGVHLIDRVSGGKKGGCSTLTEAGERAVRDYREMERALSEAASDLLAAHRATFGG